MDHQSATVQLTPHATTLEETTPHYGWRSYWVNVLLLQILALLAATPIILTVTWPKTGVAVVGYAGAILCTLPFCLILGWTHQGYHRRKAVCVWFAKGKLSCVADSTIHSAELAQCRWFYGNRTRATHPPRDQHFNGGGPAILIEFPPESRTEQRESGERRYPSGPVVVAVGFQPDTRQAWENLLLETGANHDLQSQALPAPLSSQTFACLGGLAVLLGFSVGFYGSRAIAGVLTASGVPRGLAGSICFPFFLPGSFILVAYAFLFMSLKERRCARTADQGRAAIEAWRPLMIRGWLATLTYGFIFVVFGDLMETSVTAAVAVLMCALVTLHFHLLLKGPKRGPVG